MIARLSSWWKHLAYRWNGVTPGGWRTFGIRPWRGSPFFWFVIDYDGCTRQSAKHLAECKECGQHIEDGERDD